MRDEFLRLYKDVFDTDGNIRACGRDVCKKLIELAMMIDNKANYGNVKTGFMDTDAIHELYKKEIV